MAPRIFWVAAYPSGRLAIVPRPRPGEWLDNDVAAWRAAGISMVLSLLTDQEVVELVLGSEADSRRRAGVEFVRFPIEDRGVPDSIEATGRLLDRLEQELRDQKTIALHCRVGLGRLALLTACLLVRSGLELDAAWAAITVSRGVSVPDTPEQRQWPARFARGSRAC